MSLGLRLTTAEDFTAAVAALAVSAAVVHGNVIAHHAAAALANGCRAAPVTVGRDRNAGTAKSLRAAVAAFAVAAQVGGVGGESFATATFADGSRATPITACNSQSFFLHKN